MHVLIAETDPRLRYETVTALQNVGYKVTAASDGLLAWSYLTGPRPPSLLITQIRLGVGTPPGTALGLRAHSQRIPVIYTPTDIEMAGLADPEHGAVLVRPFAINDVLATIRRLVGDVAFAAA